MLFWSYIDIALKTRFTHLEYTINTANNAKENLK